MGVLAVSAVRQQQWRKTATLPAIGVEVSRSAARASASAWSPMYRL